MAVTPNLKLPLLDSNESVSEDHLKINQFVEALDMRLGEVAATISGLAKTDHAHEMAKIIGLAEALKLLASKNHSHKLNDLADVEVEDAPDGKILQKIAGKWGLGDRSYSVPEINELLSQKVAASDLPGQLDATRDAALALMAPKIALTAKQSDLDVATAAIEALEAIVATHATSESVKALQTAISLLAPLVNPVFSGVPEVQLGDVKYQITHAGNIEEQIVTAGISARHFATVAHEAPPNTNGGTAHANSTGYIRPLNTIVTNDGDMISLSNNTITINKSGRFRLTGYAALYQTSHSVAYIGKSSSTPLIMGSPVYSSTSASVQSHFSDEVSLDQGDSLNLYYRCTTSRSDNGLGVRNQLNLRNTFARITLEKLPE